MSDLFQEQDADSAESVTVQVATGVPRAYDYLLPEGAQPAVGQFVTVPLGKRTLTGVVWGPAQRDVAKGKMKSILAVHDLPPLDGATRAFIDRMADYTMSERGAVLKMTVPVAEAFEEEKVEAGYVVNTSLQSKANKPSPLHQKILKLLQDQPSLRAAEIAHLAGCSAGVVKTMEKNGLLATVPLNNPAPCEKIDLTRKGAELSSQQKQAAETLTLAINAAKFQTFLLDGVTGSGKTEVYFEAIAAALKNKRQALILLPEIALTNAFLERFKARFGCAPALWHSALTPAQRRKTWRGIATGKTRVVIGARSALMLPYLDLGLIVVDEEHDPGYKQEDGVIYHARDMAILRASLAKFPVLLVSATPSLETLHNVWTGRFQALHLPKRYGGASLPEISLIDMRAEKLDAQHFLSTSLKQAVAETLEAGKQTLLFLNRRGYAPLTLCRHCGHRFQCPRCTAWLVEHRGRNTLQCHHCDYSTPFPTACPSCQEKGTMAACGPGVERIYDEVQAAFPKARIAVLSSDNLDGQADLKTLLEDIAAHRIDIIIGTQIIAKGHHFPQLSTVGVIDADLGLSGGDLRASERTWQLMHQVAGRAGRESGADDPGRVFLQTFMPDNRVMQSLASGERDGFFMAEIAARETAHMPPFSRLAAIIVSGRNEKQVEEVSRALAKAAPHADGLEILGPSPAALYRLRGAYRRRFLLVGRKELHIQKTIGDWLGSLKIPSAVKIQIDIDPVSFL